MAQGARFLPSWELAQPWRGRTPPRPGTVTLRRSAERGGAPADARPPAVEAERGGRRGPGGSAFDVGGRAHEPALITETALARSGPAALPDPS